jgi:hypothetical protein
MKDFIDDLESLQFPDETELDRLSQRGRMIIRHIFGSSNVYMNDFENISFVPGYIDPTDEAHQDYWQRGQNQMLNLWFTMLEELELVTASAETRTLTPDEASALSSDVSNRVFVVHGHDNAMKLEVARALERLDLEPIILHEQENRGVDG